MQTLALCLFLLGALPAMGQKIYIDYDQATAFSEYKTFMIMDTTQDLRRSSPALHEAVKQRLMEYGLDGARTPVEKDPDLGIAYYAAYYSDLNLVLGDLEYTYGESFVPGSYWDGGVGTRETRKKSFNFKEGTVIVDMWDRERGILVWRGIATAALKKDYQKNEEKLSKALDKLKAKWGKMYGDRAVAIRKLKAEQEQE